MKTIEINAADMAGRIARYKDLDPIPIQQDDEIPIEIHDLVYAREILSVIGLESADATPISVGAPIVGAGQMTMSIARCPPGQGPGLHAHSNTYETFTVLKGTFEVTWNDDGAERAVLEKFDTISVPPRVCRAFRNVGEDDAVLQVIITGGVHDMTDIDVVPETGKKIEAAGLLHKFEAIGLTFTASKNAAE
ncbi:MAG: cupin domain-containing protein [Alphaproteobacteria bacterium]|nr:cupin domain-containing protein [Alphaproteobacteria bacterium]